jgi:acetate---CoA ligase (ADP-forming)
VDMLASASPQQYAECLNILLKDEDVDAVMVILPPPPMFKAEEVARAIIEVMESDSLLSASGKPLASKKPVVIALLGSTLVEKAVETFASSKVATYPFPERAASALGALVRRAKSIADDGRLTIDHKTIVHRQSSIVSVSIDELMQAYGIPITALKLARDENEAVQIANELGYPVVMKIASPDILHKSDVGGVLLNIQDADSLSTGYTQMMGKMRDLIPSVRIEGVHIQRQITGGQEVIVGMVRDAQFGALMMFGSGGVEVEGLKDVTFCLGPLNQAEAEAMMRKTWAGRKLKGFRNIPAVDHAAVVDILIKLSRLAEDHEEIEEIEINPLRVLTKGAVAVDVRIKFSGA